MNAHSPPPSIVTTGLPNCVNNFCHLSPINLEYCQFLMQNAKFIFPLYSGLHSTLRFVCDRRYS